jgi:4a-hydroxytetrahydrobiopterin dehydratase
MSRPSRQRPPGGILAFATEPDIDTLDIPSFRPFWKAVMAYADGPGRSGPEDAIVDPDGQLPAI